MATPPVPAHGIAATKIVPHDFTTTYDPNVESFETYVLRFELHFTEKCLEPQLKFSTFLSSIDAKSFTLALYLLLPKEIVKHILCKNVWFEVNNRSFQLTFNVGMMSNLTV